MSNAIALFGSSRRNGNTGQFVDQIADVLGMEVVDLGQLRISAYDYQHRNRGDDFEPLMTRVLEVEHIIIASPVYWYAVSPPVKTFLDRICDYLDIPELRDAGRRLRGKSGYLVCTSVVEHAPEPFVKSVTDTIEYLGMRFGGMAHANCCDGYLRALHEPAVEEFSRLVRAPPAALSDKELP
jgi:multimeric flavodoxin WrbA